VAIFDDTLAAVETLSVAFWAGAAAGYAFLAAPTVAHEANDLDVQARITGTVLGRVVDVANVCEGAAIGSALLRAREADERPNDLARACAGVGAVAALRVFRRQIMPEMMRLQQAMGGSFHDIPEDDPNRIAYRAQHKRSTQVFGAALLCGIAQLVLGNIRSRA
jgi:hypothetical protein